MVISDNGTADDRLLPFVVQVDFSNRDVELSVQTSDERLDPSALFFEGRASGEMQVDGEGG